ncbi:MAG: ferritin family protein [Candidatus Altiarchaeia archaeon]
MVALWRCLICGDPYVGEEPPANCPFCGAHRRYITEAKKAAVNYDLQLNETDKANAEHALEVEISNASFYFCAADKTDDAEGKLLFKALGKVEAEHAAIWKKVLKLPVIPQKKEECTNANKENLQESNRRETRAIGFYRKAAGEAANPRIKQIFTALAEVETDHLQLSEERLKK